MPFNPPTSREARDRAIAQQRTVVNNKIESAISEGKLSTTVQGKIHESIKDMLNDHGYRISYSELGDYTRIIW